MAGPPRTLWRKASPRKATDESLLAACLPRHRPFAYPVCVAARKPRFRSGNPPRHVRSGTSVCVAASGDDPSSSTAVRRTGHCQKDDHRRNGHQARGTFTAGSIASSKKTIERITLERITIECVYGHLRAFHGQEIGVATSLMATKCVRTTFYTSHGHPCSGNCRHLLNPILKTCGLVNYTKEQIS